MDKYTDAQCRHWLAKVYEVAANSQDPSTQVGAGLVIGNVLFAETLSCNAPSFGIQMTEEEWNNRELKLQLVHHAERAAIDSAARGGLWLEGATLVAPWSACTECAKTISNTGIRRLVRHKFPMSEGEAQKWADSIAMGDRLMKAAGVKIIEIEGPIEGAPKVRRGGVLWDPSTT